MKFKFPPLESFSSEMVAAFEGISKEWQLELNVDTTRIFINLDSNNSFNKENLFRILGFNWQTEGLATAPNLYDLILNYHREMHQYGYQDQPYLRPALVFVKNDPNVLGGFIYKLIDPLQLNEVPTGYRRLVRNSETFNLPFAVIMQGLKDGLFPLMGGLHDVSHFIGFLQNKDLAVALVENIQKLPSKVSKHMGRRIILLMEYFTTMTGQPKSVIKNYLNELQIMNLSDRITIKDQLSVLSEQQLLIRAARSAEMLDKVIVDFGGACVAPWEKMFDMNLMLFNDVSENGQINFYNKLGRRKSTLQSILAFHEQMFLKEKSKSLFTGDNDTLNTRYRDKKYDVIIRTYPRMYSIMVLELLAHLSNSNLKDLAWSLDIPVLEEMNLVAKKPRNYISPIDGKVKIINDLEITSEGRRYLKNLLIDLTSAIEFQLAEAAYGMTSLEMVQSLLQPKLNHISPFGKYLEQLYPGFINDSELLDPIE